MKATDSLLATALAVVLVGCQAPLSGPGATAMGTPVVERTMESTATITEVVTATEGVTTTGETSPTTEVTGTQALMPTAAQVGSVSDYATLVETLRAAGATVEPIGAMEQAFFSVLGQQIMVNGDNVQVFEFESAEAAAVEAARISPDGSSTATTMVSWVEPPHFYRKNGLIVLYVGSDEATQELLTSLLGPQFAGQ